jgi:amidophosphoribosyltransferase
MCGINGMVFLNNVVRTEEMMKVIRFMFSELLVETQDRGHHATGLAHFRRDGAYEMHKSPVSADLFTTYDETYDSILNNLSNETSLVISHTRWYTKGKPDNNDNNHPFDIGNVIGVHNGTVGNDDYLFSQNKENFTRIAEVDSEIIYQLINFHNKDAITFEGLQEALEKSYLRGMFALAFAHKNQPNLLHVVKQERPMDFVCWQEAGVAIFNSDKKYIYNAFNKLARIGKLFGVNVPYTLTEYKLDEDRYLTLDANADSFDAMFSEPQKLFLISTAKTTYNYTNTTRGVGCGTGNAGCGTNTTKVSAADSIGRIIEGELDTISGEVIIYVGGITNVGENDDGSDLGAEETVYCVECDTELQEHEIHAAYNEGASETDSYYCKSCHEKALTGLFAG